MPYSPNVDYRAVARRKATKYGLDPHIFERQIGVESVGYSPSVISGRQASPAGAQGIAQFMPATARGLGVNPLHPKQALDAAAKLMAGYVRKYGSYRNALIAYNAGPGRVGGPLPGETVRYIANILHGHDPGHLGSPRAPGINDVGGGGRRSGVTITRHPASVTGNPGLTVGAPDMTALNALLAQQSQPQPPVTTPLQAPSFSGQSYLKTGAMSLPQTQQPVQDNGLAAKLAAIGSMTGDATLGSGQTIKPGSVTVSGQAPSGGGVHGRTLVIGDSLEVGTFPLLKQKLGGNVHGIAVGGKPSAWGIRQLRRQFQQGQYQNVVFDMGTNDATAGELRKSLHQLTQIAGNAHIYVSTVNTPFDQKNKNIMLRAFARNNPNVTLVPWHKISHGGANLPDHIHGDYGRRANVIAGALGYQPGSSGGGGAPVHGFRPGSPVPGQHPHSSTHQTDGLPGYPAYDYMAPAGTAALAPVTGRVIKLSGHDPRGGPTNGPHGPFGYSVYIKGNDGRIYYLTHMGRRNVHVGQTVRAGQRIGAVGNYAKWGGADHIHMGVHG